ncbi:MAG: hypothetical protein QXW58_04950 [Thermosphaera sp.]
MEPEELRDKIDQVLEDMHKWRRKNLPEIQQRKTRKSWQYIFEDDDP